ncbi:MULTISPECIES: DsbA family oxidoreductase [Vibrio]|jgi:predicted DsbA family dithiol-disulfide isomerase|uniref:DsbA family oxidoreductase n=1 Tax=Vibrio TaxID=662 RepID=UPI0007803E7F|nr:MULTISPECIES: DsbA family protein [Vibrio]MCF4175364.1 DsbA family protein [Vibrio sp. McD22-P3]USD99901.1 DsbA family protein [Vibrio sp. SCSIO 43133]SBO09859.1 DSBA-like thioredoxin domain protein [Vibrio mediterranei]
MVKIDYVTDVLCVWAWVAEHRNKELKNHWGDEIQIKPRFINLFGDTGSRIADGWKDRGGFEGFAAHTVDVVTNFPELQLHKNVWTTTRPTSSMPAHLYLKAFAMSGASDSNVQSLASTIRDAFFSSGRDVSDTKVLHDILESQSISVSSLDKFIENGEAYAALWSDQLFRENHQIKGSPTYILDGGRQVLFGNVSFHVINANIRELAQPASKHGVSWC